MSDFLRDVRHALRMLRGNPGFTSIAVLALALGIGSTTAIFSVVNAVLLRDLPYDDASRIVTLAGTDRTTGVSTNDVSPANFLDWEAQNNAFSEMAASRAWRGNLTGRDRPERLLGAMTTGNYFHLFGVRPILGRSFTENDATPANHHVVVLGYGLWQKLFAGAPDALGQSLTLDGEPYTVIGVMPRSFSPDQYAELWLPSPWDVPSHPLIANQDPRGIRDRDFLQAWGRLRPGVTVGQARAEMDAIARRLEKQYPDFNGNVGIAVLPMREDLVGNLRPVLYILLGAVGFVLLIGCANVANLLLARATARAREISIRTALGATRGRLIRQLLTESVLLALLGGALGVLLANWAVHAVLALAPAAVTGFDQIGVNLTVLGFTFFICCASGILFGLVPALHASSWNANDALKESGRGVTGGHNRTRSLLVAAEVGFSVILLIGAGLLVKSFVRLMHVDPGFSVGRLLVFSISPTPSQEGSQLNFYRRVLEQLRALPGVQSVSAVSRLPFSGGNSTRSFKVPGDPNNNYEGDYRISMPGYFRTMGIPLLKGRDFDDHDTQNSTPVIVINQELARTSFPGQDPIGRYIYDFDPDNGHLRAQIIGVVGNIRHADLDSKPRPEMYLPLGQAQWFSMSVAVRTSGSNPLLWTSAAQNAVWSVDKNVPLGNLKTMDYMVSDSVARRRFTMVLLAIFAGLAIFLASIGLYGVVSYSVSQRSHEIGIRMALGASSGNVLGLILREGMKSAWIGVGAGLLASIFLSRLMVSLLYGVGANDPLVFVAIPLALTAVALFASYVPARRATKVDPIVALRYE